jgi:hypothetical protein
MRSRVFRGRCASVGNSRARNLASVRAADDDELRIDDSEPPAGASPNAVGAWAQQAPSDPAAEADPVETGAALDAEAADLPALGGDLDDHELDERGFPQEEGQDRLPAPLRAAASDPVAVEVEAIDLCSRRPVAR